MSDQEIHHQSDLEKIQDSSHRSPPKPHQKPRVYQTHRTASSVDNHSKTSPIPSRMSSPGSRNLDRHLVASHNTSEEDDEDYYQQEQHKRPKSRSKSPQKPESIHYEKSKKKRSIPKVKSSKNSTISSDSSASDIQEIKSSLKEHFEAIKSLQTALQVGKPRLASSQSNYPPSASANDIRDRIRMIEATLRDVGENPTTGSDFTDPSRMPFSNNTSRPPTGASFIPFESFKPSTNLNQSTIIADPYAEQMKERLDKMEKVMADISNTLQKQGESVKTVNQTPLVHTQKVDFVPAHQPPKQKDSIATSRAENMNTSSNDEQISRLVSDLHKLRFDFKNQERVNQELWEKNQILESKLEQISSKWKRNQIEDQDFESKVQSICKKVIGKDITNLQSILNEKVDTAVLEELARHIATKEELKKYVKKTSLNKIMVDRAVLSSQSNNQNHQVPNFDLKGREITDKLKAAVKKLGEDFKKIESRIPSISPEKHSELFIQGQIFDIESKMERKLQDWLSKRIETTYQERDVDTTKKIAEMKENVEIGVKALISDSVRKALDVSSGNSLFSDVESNPLIRKLVRDFDEKLYTVCSDLSACKQLFVNQSNQPFYRCAQWSWTSGSLKLGSAVPWNLQTTNTGIL